MLIEPLRSRIIDSEWLADEALTKGQPWRLVLQEFRNSWSQKPGATKKGAQRSESPPQPRLSSSTSKHIQRVTHGIMHIIDGRVVSLITILKFESCATTAKFDVF